MPETTPNFKQFSCTCDKQVIISKTRAHLAKLSNVKTNK